MNQNSIPVKIARPLPPAPDVPHDELEARLRIIRKEMERDHFDVIVLSDKKNIQYFADFHTLSWAYKARPVFGIITANDFFVLGSKTESKNVNLKPRAFTAQYYDGYLAEAVELVVNSICKSCKGIAPRIGLDYGQDMVGVGSLELVDTLNNLSSGGKVLTAAQTLWRVRLIKSPFEASLKRTAFAIVNDAFDRAIADARLGMPEYELYQRMQAEIFLNGAESADQIAMLFSKGDFAYGRQPSERRLEPGHYIWTDFRATYGGYPADRNRTARAGEPEQWERETYTLMRDLTHALARSVRGGMTCADVYANFGRLWNKFKPGQLYGAVSRIGHGGGMDVTEPPSLSSSDHTEIRPGMILHIEPKLERDGAVFQFEEVIYVRDDGVEFLSALSPEVIPVIL
ncbi:Peptidase M24 (plasmid) [Cupriavidus taiwanensis]|uniref:Peptidase M24 n=1 Tax=Cupriavidus taiwanensis TaxID=164546 RepID=A0A375FGX7_9BURK|nr:Xaa-Pro peptidase family protein [Cupriavidus taiwanensis]SOZ70934.1 Peptidase M24 [Cupriavidus taiwanensis]SOZ72128.1 Peptidase M24 [Cupriavidus taiwanensis]SOZ74424.1 Peptidase M24 [Cupriavidus taiwanensis]SPA03330.1 Peptidase M24 [Cupriavidus taiwanensis]SPA11305.1 Peptidase M24 [Cupriavidus taiwanensis]